MSKLVSARRDDLAGAIDDGVMDEREVRARGRAAAATACDRPRSARAARTDRAGAARCARATAGGATPRSPRGCPTAGSPGPRARGRGRARRAWAGACTADTRAGPRRTIPRRREVASPSTPGTSRATASIIDERAELAARQHVVADRELLVDRELDHALVDALVAAAHEHEVRQRRELAHARLGQRRARGRQQDAMRARASACAAPPPGDRGEQRLGLHHHARAAAVRRVVDGAVAIGREVARVDRLDRDRPGLARAPDHAGGRARARSARAGS